MKKVVILSGVRKAIGRYGGSLRDVPVYQLGVAVLSEAVKRGKEGPEYIDNVVMDASYQNQGEKGTRMLGLSDNEMEAKVNVKGSDMSLGHPIGGGGQGICMILERP